MLDSLITSKTRIKLLMRLFLNSNSYGHLRGLQTEFGESSNAIRLELNRFEQAGLLTSRTESNRKVYSANTTHPLYPEINSILRKHLGFDQIIERIIEKLGKINEVYLEGEFAHGRESNVINMLIVGDNINTTYLDALILKSQNLIKRAITYKLLTPDSFHTLLNSTPPDGILLLWKQND